MSNYIQKHVNKIQIMLDELVKNKSQLIQIVKDSEISKDLKEKIIFRFTKFAKLEITGAGGLSPHDVAVIFLHQEVDPLLNELPNFDGYEAYPYHELKGNIRDFMVTLYPTPKT